MRTIALPDGTKIPALGLGTWRMGEDARQAEAEARALAAGLDLGLTLIDTAEMYGEGGAESIVAKAIAGRRDQVFLVSKVYPHNAGRKDAVAACERSLQRLGTDYLDLYLLHWRGRVPLEETVAAFEALKAAGKIRNWGVSNFDVGDMEELSDLAAGCATNQVLYNLAARGIEWDLLPWCAERRLPIMAYSPLGQGVVLKRKPLTAVAERHGVSPATIAIAWTLRQPHVIAIPKAATAQHLEDNAKALAVALTGEDLAELDAAFPPPSGPVPLEVI